LCKLVKYFLLNSRKWLQVSRTVCLAQIDTHVSVINSTENVKMFLSSFTGAKQKIFNSVGQTLLFFVLSNSFWTFWWKPHDSWLTFVKSRCIKLCAFFSGTPCIIIIIIIIIISKLKNMEELPFSRQHDSILTLLTYRLYWRWVDPLPVLTDQVAVANQVETEVTFIDRAVVVTVTMKAYNSVLDITRPTSTRRWRHIKCPLFYTSSSSSSSYLFRMVAPKCHGEKNIN